MFHVLLTLLFFSPSVLLAEDVFDLAAEYNQIQKKVTKLESEKREMLAEIYKVERETNRLVLDKTKLDEKKIKLDLQLIKISKKIVETERNIEQQIPDLVDRLQFAEQINNLPWFYTFLTSQSIDELDQTFQTAENLNDYQAENIAKFIQSVKTLEDKKNELNKVALSIVESKKEIKKKEKKIAENQKTKKKFLSRLESRLKNRKRKLTKVKRKGRKKLESSLFKDLGMLFGSAFFDQKGNLPSPIDVPVTLPYGLNQGLLKDSVQLTQKGNFYKTGEALDVKSVASGRVRFAGKVKGYGSVVVIDHGSRYYTTYANLKNTKVKKGSEILKRQKIGQTGFNHLQLGRGLYFEVRHFSQPQDPAKWLKAEKNNLAKL